MISNPSTLEEWFEWATIATEPPKLGGMGITLSEFSDMSPWNFEFILHFKTEHRAKMKKMQNEK